MQGAYILRTLKSVDFQYDSGVEKLIGVQSQVAAFHGMRPGSMEDEILPQYDLEHEHGYPQESRMRLGTIINLESRLAVSNSLIQLEMCN